MLDEAVKKILESIDESSVLTETYPKFSGEGYRAHRIDIKNFHEIKKINSGKRIAFVDGGNAEIISSANFSLSLIRVCCLVYQNKKKIAARKFETLAFTQAAGRNGEIHYDTSFFNDKNNLELGEISFSSFDHTLMTGISRAEISGIPNAIRRFAELKMAKLAADNHLSDIIILDGSLQSTLTNENKYLDGLYELCIKNNAALGALSKTNSMFTENGNLLSAVLMSISKLDSWFYHPIADIISSRHRAEMFFAKFHDKSRHAFRFEVFNAQKIIAEEIISSLALNCTDPVFIGYPYGAIEADRTARVSNQEKDSLKTMLLVKLRSRNIEKYLNSSNAHEILDRISF